MSVHGCFSQTQIDSLTAKRSIKLNGTRVTGISKDTTTANKRDTMLITEKAAKDYADKVAASSSGLDTSVADARYVRIQTQNPTGSLSGGGNYELHSSGTFSSNLSWSVTRLAAGTNLAPTANIDSIKVAGINQTYTPPAPGQTVSGTQSVNVTWNTPTAFYITAYAHDGKTYTSSVSFNFYPSNYYGYSASSSPNASTILATAGGSSFLSATKAYSPTVTLPNSGYYYVYYAYPTSFGALTSIKDGAGNQVISAFTQTTVSVTNASGYTQNYYVYTSNNNYSNTSIYVQYQ